jgi:pimeloyl-ACP methyl ester carboxylesterase
MKRPHIIIYVTGLGDKNVFLQAKAIGLWRICGVQPRLFQVNWTNAESYSQKLKRLLALIDIYSEREYKISLVGASAGASVAIAAFSRRKEIISGVVCICGKLRRPETVELHYYKHNPAFRGAMKELVQNLAKLSSKDKKRILSIRPLYDQTVSAKDTKIDGALQKIIPSFYHVPSIALALTVFSPILLFFLIRRSTIKS